MRLAMTRDGYPHRFAKYARHGLRHYDASPHHDDGPAGPHWPIWSVTPMQRNKSTLMMPESA